MAMSIEDVKKAEKLIKQPCQIVAATWTHIAGLGSDAGYSGCRTHLCAPEGRA